MLTPIIFPIWIAQNAGKSENSGKPRGFGTWFAYQALWARLAAWKADSSTSDLKALALEISCFRSFRIWVGNISWSTESVANSIVILVPQLGDCVCVSKENIPIFGSGAAAMGRNDQVALVITCPIDNELLVFQTTTAVSSPGTCVPAYRSSTDDSPVSG